jgi:hypothetical protein
MLCNWQVISRILCKDSASFQGSVLALVLLGDLSSIRFGFALCELRTATASALSVPSALLQEDKKKKICWVVQIIQMLN